MTSFIVRSGWPSPLYSLSDPITLTSLNEALERNGNECAPWAQFSTPIDEQFMKEGIVRMSTLIL